MDVKKNIDPKLAETLKGIYDSLTDEQKEKAKQCKTMDELMVLAGKEGIELPDELLDAVAGGYIYKTDPPFGRVMWQVLDDKTLDVLYEDEWHMNAEDWAREHGQSTAILSQWALEQKKKERDSGC